ncbi:MAG TPA: CDP-alcohol phosphatidyltransferase family protein [Polyangiales bacterium]|nr:CDP-alcohol phosphatidyltransferase family protein [Polyangiales bacterium]
MADFARDAAWASRGLAVVMPLAALDRRALALLGPLALGWLVHRLRHYAAPSVLPNVVTALRVALTSALALFVREPHWQAAFVLAVFTIDGLDGWLARRLLASSPQGAHFDMEADGFLVLVVCSLLFERVGAWVLLGGLLRYAFVLVTWVFPSRGEAPRSVLARYAFAASIAAYVAALLVSSWLPAALATLVLTASFGRSFFWSFRA